MTENDDRIAPGKGLLDGLAVTFKTMTRRSTTQQYPDVEPDLPPRSRGVIALLEENCTVCMLCARECPDWCIYIDSHKEEVVVPGAARARQRNVLDRFDIDFSLCMYCGICIEVCPFGALHWTPEFEYAETDVLSLLHDKTRLGDWMRTVPPPPAHDVLGEPSKEEATAARKAAGPGAATAAKTARPAAVRPKPAQSPPAQTPPAQTPPAQTPPAQTPPAQTPPAESPQAEGPPAQPEPEQ
ncbi:4Fe-4S binding protein [Actinoplanes sp. GCM10030250]|uniref:NuoI/complex I 23 kDa subunit family protein n=1 Tax=Actinoplanes sp. GCM10030250 TaxID=3273376 RepID=UPI00360B9CA6